MASFMAWEAACGGVAGWAFRGLGPFLLSASVKDFATSANLSPSEAEIHSRRSLSESTPSIESRLLVVSIFFSAFSFPLM